MRQEPEARSAGRPLDVPRRPADALEALGVGWHNKKGCWTFPECGADGTVEGINVRYADGRKRMLPGSARALYYADDWEETAGPVFLPEGASDAAALVAMGLSCVGRPSNTGGANHLAALLSDLPAGRPVIVLGENDRKPDGSWPGRHGALATAEKLAEQLGRPVLYAFPPPPHKDVREWLAAQDPDPGDPARYVALGRAFAGLLVDDAREVISWGALLPLDAHAVPPFPTDALAGWQRDFVVALATETQTPTDLAAMLVLSAAATACAKKAVVRVRPDFGEPLNVFTATSQPPASRKSAVLRRVTAPLRDFERARADEARPLAAEARTRAVIAARTLGELEKKAAKAAPGEQASEAEKAQELARTIAETLPPRTPRLIAGDVTPEKLVSLMAENGGRISILDAEGGIFGMMAGLYSDSKKGEKLHPYLKAHAGDTIRVDRMNRESEYIDAPALTIGVAVQPGVIQGLAEYAGFRDLGLLARFLYAMPASRVGRRITEPPAVPEAVRGVYRQRTMDLLDLPFGATVSGEPAEHVITLSREAYACLMTFSSWLEPKLGEFGELEHISDWAGKLVGAVARLAGLLHAADLPRDRPPWGEPIPRETMERAVRIGHYLIPHALKAFALMGARRAVAEAHYVWSWVRRRGADSFTKKECFDGTRGRFGQVTELEPALRLLERHDYVRERAAPSGVRRGRPPSPTYDVNPAALAEQAPVRHTPDGPQPEPGPTASPHPTAGADGTDGTEGDRTRPSMAAGADGDVSAVESGGMIGRPDPESDLVRETPHGTSPAAPPSETDDHEEFTL